MDDERVVVGTFIGRVQADLAAAHLRASGIEADVVADDAGGAIPPLQLASGAKVLVLQSREADAREILESGGHLSEVEPSGATPRSNFWGLVLVALSAAVVLWVLYQVLRFQQAG